MQTLELSHILTAVVIYTIVSGFSFALKAQWNLVLLTLAFSFIIIAISVLTKKTAANLLDSDVEHEVWEMSNFGFTPQFKAKKPIPMGLILPLILAIISLGAVKFSAFLTYETRALKHRAAKRFGVYSYTEMTDWHNALIGAAGIMVLLLLSLITYLLPVANLELLSKMAAYYAFWNILPISKLDGTQIFFGSRILWAILATTTAIFAFFAFTIV